MIKEHKKELVIVGLMLLLIIALIGVSYAAFSYSKLGTKVNTITTGSITMSYEETDNTISLSGALPTTDATGKKRLTDGEYFDFTVSSNIVGDVNINYEISAKDVTTSERKIDGSNIKLYLTRLTDDGEEELMTPETYNEEASSNSYTGRPSGEMSLYTSSMNSSESNNYRLRMWVSEDYNPQGDGGNLEFSVKINVYGQDRVAEEVSTVLLNNIPKENQYDDDIDTFITGTDPNNYVWYSGKLWRAVSVNNEAKTTKLVTQWNISAITYSSGSTAFEGSYMEDWLNDTTVDGFLYNLREPEKFIKMDSKWNASMMSDNSKPPSEEEGGTIVEDAVGLLNIYEYVMGGDNGSYLNNGLYWHFLTPTSTVYSGIRPSINLKPEIKIVNGEGTNDNPYRLEGDNDINLEGTLLNTRYSGEYIRFGNDENNLYRIVSHETEGLTKITNVVPLKENGTFKTISFGDTYNYSSTNTIGAFLNGEYLTNYVGNDYINMIEENTTWYLGNVNSGSNYKLSKYQDESGETLITNTTIAAVGLLRLGELMSSQFDISKNNTSYWTLTTAMNRGRIYNIANYGGATYNLTREHAIRLSLNLKQNVIITGGTGLKNDPFTLELAN